MMSEGMTTENLPIGVIGLGNLGKKLVAQIVWSGGQVLVFDQEVQLETIREGSSGIDPSLKLMNMPLGQCVVQTAKPVDIIQACPVMHWAVPSEHLELPPIPAGRTVVLHDSVMHSSTEAVRRRSDKAQFVIAHCLMNQDKRVIVSPESGNFLLVKDHFRAIGLIPKEMTAKDHDTMLARTQGVFALLIASGLGKELDSWFEAGDLTPSAMELRLAVRHRESRWTEDTLRSILRNSQLKNFTEHLADALCN